MVLEVVYILTFSRRFLSRYRQVYTNMSAINHRLAAESGAGTLTLLPFPSANSGVKRKHPSSPSPSRHPTTTEKPKALVEKPRDQTMHGPIQPATSLHGANTSLPVRKSVLPAAEYRFNVASADHQHIENGVKTLEIRCVGSERVLTASSIRCLRMLYLFKPYFRRGSQTKCASVFDHSRERPHSRERKDHGDCQCRAEVHSPQVSLADGNPSASVSSCRKRVVWNAECVRCCNAALSPVFQRRGRRETWTRGV